MSIAVIITDRNTDVLCQKLRVQLPDVVIQQWPDIDQPEQVIMAVLWRHPPGIIKNLPNLKMVVSMGAGMDHIHADEAISNDIKRERVMTLALQQNMAQYVLSYVLRDYRHQSAYVKQQLNRKWQVLEKQQSMPVVGFLGLGALGTFVADRCLELGFETMAWTAQKKQHGHPSFQGKAGLQHVCASSQYLVVLLPLNEQTKYIINAETLSWCASDCTIINVARGGHVNATDLINALAQGQIKQAVLDVFEQEPLPADHEFWSHPKITLTPHSSARSDEQQTADQIVAHYQSIR